MKKVACFVWITLISILVLEAQDTKKIKLYRGQKVWPVVKMPLVDTNLFRAVPIENFISKKSEGVNIPNALGENRKYDNYKMPILKLSGDYLAPMPGTEILEQFQWKDSIDEDQSVKNSVIQVFKRK